MTILPKQQAERGDDGDGRPPGVGPRPRASPTPPAPGGLALAGASSSSSCGPSAGGSSSSASSSSCSSSSAAAEDAACQASASISSSNPSSAGGGGSSGPAGSCPPGSASCSSSSSSSSSPGSGSPCTGEGSSGPGGSALGACCSSSSCSGPGQAQAAASHWQLLQEPAASAYPRHHRRPHRHHHHRHHHKRRHRASPHRSGRMGHRGAGGPPTPGPGPPLGLHPHHLLHYRRPQASPSPPGGGGGGGGAGGGGGGGGAGGRGGLLHHLLEQHRRRLLQQQQHRRRLPPRGEPEEEEEDDDDEDEDEEGGAGPGYNSEDEYETAAREQQQQMLQDPAKLEQQEHWFEKALSEKKGFVIKRMKEDGACLFRAVADQVYGDQDMHDVVRKHCMDYLVKNADYFSNYVTEDFATYISRKRVSSCHGNHIEMQAMAEMYNRPVEVYQYGVAGEGTSPINTFHSIHQTEDEPIRVSYHRNIHYNSVVNPNKATIGVGLGLPAFKPGSADQSLMKNAIKTSEESWIEQQMLEDKKRATDWEATNEAIEEQVARESYLQWLRDQEKQVQQVSLAHARSAPRRLKEVGSLARTRLPRKTNPHPPLGNSDHTETAENFPSTLRVRSWAREPLC
ncbi:LOW QUALITY PROTEIN: OTU domain-containing protein 5-B-like [Stegostoma tigrinum]|uniref:LOW QUALITY PROTEIN: OTU domain-containing protein 5-B-like n=1 Tax=Stegostoma tigrinum TaxID=3053191 RepID=UPI0028700098|nr:LOW QUALITY PROTEIN: OTU domain-containing protein 5-B-like [Stegostoma tigrinum]